ncbi:MAG: fatty acid desaturase, partial [Chitinophagaceae bacterium]|nr:fatty acid desaturase [Chitinophagaceae bacterium]
MLEGKELILATKKYAIEDRRKSWFHLLSTLVLMAATLTAIVLLDIVVVRAVLSILLGLLSIRTFIIYHDFEHHAILYKSKAANVIMTVFGLLILAPPSIWKRSHDYHHAHNSKLFSASIGSYPIVTKDKFMAMSAGERRVYLFIRHPLTIALGYFTMFIFGMCINSFASAPKKHMDSLLALILHVAISAGIIVFAGWEIWLFAMFIPHLIASAIGAYLFYAQHNF